MIQTDIGSITVYYIPTSKSHYVIHVAMASHFGMSVENVSNVVEFFRFVVTGITRVTK